MSDDVLHLSIEPPLTITASARKSLEKARREALQSSSAKDAGSEEDGLKDSINSLQSTVEKITKLDTLRRAWIDENRSVKPPELPLSIRLQKLWSERGDFSRFRASTLLNDDSIVAKDGNADDAAVEEDLGAILSDLEDAAADADGQKKDGELDKEGTLNTKNGDVMSIQDMIQVRKDMLDKLGLAHNSLYFSHALVSLLINSTKPGNEAPSMAGSGGPGSITRAGSAAASNRLGADLLGGAASSRSVTGGTQAMGSSTALETELGIEPYVFGASRLEALRRDVEHSREDEDEDENMDEDDDDEGAEKERLRVERQIAKLLDEEVEEHAKDLIERVEGKKEGIRSAIDILRKGAKTIHPENEGAGREKVRWQALMLARRSGWSLTPDKPVRGTAAKKRELLQDFGPIKRDEPARDAWIGYGVPESSIRYARQALAYLSHSSTEGDRPADALLFASRPQKKVKLEVIIGEEVWTSDGPANGEDQRSSLDQVLRQAQSEFVDEELFDSIVAESRILSIAGLSNVSIDNEDQVTFDLNAFTKLRFVRQDTSKEVTDETGEGQHASPIMTSMLAILRLGLIRRYRQKAGIESKQKEATTESENVKAPLLQSLLGLIHYASFSAHLHVKLTLLTKLYPNVQLDLNMFERIGDVRSWLMIFLQQSDKIGNLEAIKQLGGSGTIFIDGKPFAYLSFGYPSQISLTLPLRKLSDGSGTGVNLPSVDLTSLEGILTKELVRLQGSKESL
ncbi:uncharacterized protein FA14DRAFT_173262 [Meira miltonrushii]|uniref:Mediator of RNA polymerase II transcription subunit 17 n=1 Tax=Meira miltonrushii TaxID=1280837 RepID=A0A316VB67_9BASI|nr:uncharacterized protein FA14DRAFT_173262 [Meira miltonrushii]PWN33463.1 hypothetical protein FA14DRAFT_173262 [Meira miltonrushii]